MGGQRERTEGEGRGWLLRFKTTRLRRIVLATLPRYGRTGADFIQNGRGLYRFSSREAKNTS